VLVFGTLIGTIGLLTWVDFSIGDQEIARGEVTGASIEKTILSTHYYLHIDRRSHEVKQKIYDSVEVGACIILYNTPLHRSVGTKVSQGEGC